MDELPEFDRDVIEALRQPLEDRMITISRAQGSVTFPAQCMLVASMNPCPCGRGKDAGCACPEQILKQYRRKLSQPIIDRIDIWVSVAKIDYEQLSSQETTAEKSSSVRSRVIGARLRQSERFRAMNISISYNGEMGVREIERCVKMDDTARKVLRASAEKLGLSGRAFHRVIKVAQTIVDLDGRGIVDTTAILEAMQYRQTMLD